MDSQGFYVYRYSMDAKNHRRDRRIPYMGAIRISWEDHGQPFFAMCKCIDISRTGVRIECPSPVGSGSMIQVGAERIKLAGSAKVRHVNRSGSKYLVGLQLTYTLLPDTISRLELN